TPGTVPDAEPPNRLVASHSCVTSESGSEVPAGGHGTRRIGSEATWSINSQAVRRVFGFARGSRRGPGSSTIALSPGINQQPAGQRSGVPPPSYFGSSLDHARAQSVSTGGASSGSANEVRFTSPPRFPRSSRSSA